MPNDKDTLEAIKNALSNLKTEADYEYVDENAVEWLRYLLQQLEWWERAAETQKDNNLKILSQLQQSREENERISADREFWMNLYQQERDLCKGQKESLIEINGRISADAERLLEENERLRGELEQAKTEREKYQTALHEEQRESVRLGEILDRIGNICIEHENAKHQPIGTVRLIQKLAAYSERGESQ